MKSFFGKSSLILALTLCLFSASAWADTVYLKNGQKVEGKILSQTETEIQIEVAIGSIKDKRTIPMADVDRVDKPKPDDVAFEGLQDIIPVRDMATADDYRTRLKRTQDFLATYIGSDHAADVTKMRDQLQTELDLVTKGSLKVNGEWLTPSEARMHSENIDAIKAYRGMIGYASAGGTTNLLNSLRTFEKIDEQYEGTRAHAQAVEDAQKVLNAYGRALTGRLEEAKANKELEARQAERLTDQQKAQLKQAWDDEKARFDRQIEQEKAAKQKWLSVYNRDEKSIETAITQVKKELDLLQKVDLAALKAKADGFWEVESLLAEGKVNEADEKFSSLSKSRKNSKDPYVQALIGKLDKALSDEAQALALKERVNSEASKTADAMAKSTSANPGAEDSAEPEVDALAALAMSSKPKPAATEDKKPPVKKPPVKSSSSSSSAAKTTPPAVAKSGGGGGLPFNPMFLVAGVLIIVTVVVFLKQKKAGGGAE